MRRFGHLAVSAALATFYLGSAGCEPRSDEPLAYERRPVEGVARNDIPASAKLMKEGHEPLLFQAPSDGVVWVYNDSDERLVYTGAIRAGQTVHVDPDHDFVLVNGQKVVDMKMDDFDRHQILFGPATLSGTTTAQPTQQPAVIVQPNQPNSVTIEQQPSEVRVKGSEVQVQPSGVKVTPRN